MVALKEHKDGIMSATPSYYEEKVKKRQEIERKEHEYLEELFHHALEFYKANYPKSTQKIPIKWEIPKKPFSLKGKKDFIEELKELTTEAKLHARLILYYSIKERNYTKVESFHKLNELRGRLKNLIPGGKLLDKIEKIENEKREKEEILIRLKQEYADAVAKAEAESKPKPPAKIICDICQKECSSPAGLSSHKRSAHPTPQGDLTLS
jgi:hypothetical protein